MTSPAPLYRVQDPCPYGSMCSEAPEVPEPKSYVLATASKSANIEAIEQLRRGLALVEALSDMRERAERELDLQMALGPALFATKVYSHPDIGRTYARAWELCRQLVDHPREFTALRGLQNHHINEPEMEKALHFAEEALRVAERLDDAARLVGFEDHQIAVVERARDTASIGRSGRMRWVIRIANSSSPMEMANGVVQLPV